MTSTGLPSPALPFEPGLLAAALALVAAADFLVAYLNADLAQVTGMRCHDAAEGRGIALATALRRRLEQPRLEPTMLTSTKFATAAEKAAFARHFVRFLAQGMPAGQFTKPFYQRLYHDVLAYCSL